MLHLNTGLHGRYNLVVNRADGTTDESGWFDNLITDFGMNQLGTPNPGGGGDQILGYCRVGTGTTPPAVSNVSLEGQVGFSGEGGAAISQVAGVAPLYATTLTFKYTFSQGAVVGNISEIGIGKTQTDPDLFTRALITTTGGAPTTLSLSSIDQLIVFYELKVYPPVADATGTIQISGSTYSYVVRPIVAAWMTNSGSNAFRNGVFSQADGFLSYTGDQLSQLGPITAYPQIAGAGNGTPVSGTYVPGTFYRDGTFSLGINSGNVQGGLHILMLGYGPSSDKYFKVFLNPGIPKDTTKTLTLTFRLSWARV